MQEDRSESKTEMTPGPEPIIDDAEVEIRRIARRSFLWAVVAGTATFSAWRWLVTRRPDNGIPWPLRRVIEVNEQLGRDYFKPSRVSREFPREMAREPRTNGLEGMEDGFDPSAWQLRVVGLASIPSGAKTDADVEEPTLLLTMEDIRALPHSEMVTELRCIEGWSEVVHWGGVRLKDFASRYMAATQSGKAPDIDRRPQDLLEYVSMETPGGGYYVGLDMQAALHPQTLLCYEMNGKPLTLEHGAPLRLVIPVMYGVKSIKRIETIRFTSERPADYWAERGYDWYTGH